VAVAPVSWAEIDTAPKDRPILVYAPPFILTVLWAETAPFGCWRCAATSHDLMRLSPTHWMPIPDPPGRGPNMRALGCALEHKDIWLAPVGMLTPNRVVSGDPHPPDLFDDIDRDGMRYPVICYPLTRAEWTDWVIDRPPALRVTPVVHADRIWICHVGNQRLRYAVERGYTHVACVLERSYAKAYEWQQAFCREAG